MKREFAIQLYSVRDMTERDFTGTLKRLAELGYSGVEFAGFGGISAKDMKSYLDAFGLKAVASHVGADDLRGDSLKRQIEYHNIIGAEYIICPWYEIKSLDDVSRLAQLLNTAGRPQIPWYYG